MCFVELWRRCEHLTECFVEVGSQLVLFVQMRVFNSLCMTLDMRLFPRSLRGHRHGTKCITLSNTTSHVALTAGYDRLARLWDLNTGQCLGQLCGHRSIITWGRLSPDDSRVVTVSLDCTAKGATC